jgi:hypothetical protein
MQFGGGESLRDDEIVRHELWQVLHPLESFGCHGNDTAANRPARACAVVPAVVVAAHQAADARFGQDPPRSGGERCPRVESTDEQVDAPSVDPDISLHIEPGDHESRLVAVPQGCGLRRFRNVDHGDVRTERTAASEVRSVHPLQTATLAVTASDLRPQVGLHPQWPSIGIPPVCGEHCNSPALEAEADATRMRR